MKVVSPAFDILTPIDGIEILKTIETVGRTCYKSEDKITDDSCVNFVQGIINRGHEAVIEHYNITVRLTNDRGVSHEEVRHRIAPVMLKSLHGIVIMPRINSVMRLHISTFGAAWNSIQRLASWMLSFSLKSMMSGQRLVQMQRSITTK